MNDVSLDPGARRVAGAVLSGFIELRSRATKAALTLLAVFLGLLPFADRVFTLIADPMIAKLPEGSSLISKQIASPFLTPLKAVLWVALFATMPVLLYHVWRLLERWLPPTGRRVAAPLMIASGLLFYTGVAFAWLIVLPMVFGFFTSVAPQGVTVMTDINAYLSFTIGMLFAFGLAFQVPIAIVILVWTGLVSRQSLAKSRPYVFLGAFVVGMFLTPPDVFSQTLLAVPMYLLFEAALFVCARFLPEGTPADTEQE